MFFPEKKHSNKSFVLVDKQKCAEIASNVIKNVKLKRNTLLKKAIDNHERLKQNYNNLPWYKKIFLLKPPEHAKNYHIDNNSYAPLLFNKYYQAKNYGKGIEILAEEVLTASEYNDVYLSINDLQYLLNYST